MPPRRQHRRPGGPVRGSTRTTPFAHLGGRGAPGAGARGAAASGAAAPARVLVDGRNVQHALARAAGAADLPTAALVARLRAAFASPTEVELILDGHAAGSPFGKVAPGFHVTFTRGATADQVIGERVTEALRSLGAAGAWSVVVVTDDREVIDHARRSGVRVERTAWLVDRLAAAAGGRATIGNVAPRPPKG